VRAQACVPLAIATIDHHMKGMPQISATALYQPPSHDLPFLAVVFDPERVIHAVRPFPSEAAAQGFLQAFMQEKAGEYGLAPESVSGEK
jgi:hypothetical protein